MRIRGGRLHCYRLRVRPSHRHIDNSLIGPVEVLHSLKSQNLLLVNVEGKNSSCQPAEENEMGSGEKNGVSKGEEFFECYKGLTACQYPKDCRSKHLKLKN
uniref:Uncharacterized protein n=1 Tax=Oryza sativa subsp. japonica TaxID=39947 RepID=Q8GVH1_ORYSJ|nr:hypothetical protein [Oryza sativa Japonica Group]